MLKVGDKAPNFILKSDQDVDVSLGEFLGKNDVILYFPPYSIILSHPSGYISLIYDNN